MYTYRRQYQMLLRDFFGVLYSPDQAACCFESCRLGFLILGTLCVVLLACC